jgi:protein ImuA
VVEDAVRDGTLSAVIAEVSRMSMVATRCLQLVAAEADIPVLILGTGKGGW